MKKSFWTLLVVLLVFSSCVTTEQVNEKQAIASEASIAVQESRVEDNSINELEENGYTPLGNSILAAAESGEFSMIADVLEQGADPNRIDAEGTPSIIQALCSHLCVEVVRILIEAGADVNAEDSDGITPLMAAILFEDFESTSLLLDSRADLYATYRDGESIPFLAVENSRDAVFLERMISELDELNMKNNEGVPLLFAALENEYYSKVVVELLSAGADPYITTDDGRDLLDYIDEYLYIDEVEKMEWYPLLSDLFDLDIEPEDETPIADVPDWMIELYKPDSQYFYVIGKGSNPRLSIAMQKAKADALNQAALEKYGIIEQYITEYIVENHLEGVREYVQETVSKVSADIMITSMVTIDSYSDDDTYYILTGIPIEYLTPAVNEAFEIIAEKVTE